MALDGVFMRFDVNDNFFENNVLFWKTKGGGNIRFYKYPATYKRGLKQHARRRIQGSLGLGVRRDQPLEPGSGSRQLSFCYFK